MSFFVQVVSVPDMLGKVKMASSKLFTMKQSVTMLQIESLPTKLANRIETAQNWIVVGALAFEI